MNRIIIQKDEKLYFDTKIDYSIYTDTYITVSNKVYFTDGDNFFHFTNNSYKNSILLEDFYILIFKFKKLFNICNTYNTRNIDTINILTQTSDNKLEKPNVYTMDNDEKFIIEIPKDTIIKMNDIPITLATNTLFEIKPDTKFIIPEYNNIEIISRNNIYNISNKEKINVKYSKLI